MLQLGVTTTTDDAEGEVVERRSVPDITQDGLNAVLQGFVGHIAQTPPIYSALKRAGKPLYAYARAGQEVQVQPRMVRIDAIESAMLEGSRLSLDVRCGKGTYLRALARDIGRALGCGAHLAALRRTASGGFDVRQACTLDALRELDARGARGHLLPVDCLVQDLPRVDLDMSQSARMLHGQSLAVDPAPDLPPGSVRLHGLTDSNTPCFLGIARWDGHALSPQRLLSNEELHHAVNTP